MSLLSDQNETKVNVANDSSKAGRLAVVNSHGGAYDNYYFPRVKAAGDKEMSIQSLKNLQLCPVITG